MIEEQDGTKAPSAFSRRWFLCRFRTPLTPAHPQPFTVDDLLPYRAARPPF